MTRLREGILAVALSGLCFGCQAPEAPKKRAPAAPNATADGSGAAPAPNGEAVKPGEADEPTRLGSEVGDVLMGGGRRLSVPIARWLAKPVSASHIDEPADREKVLARLSFDGETKELTLADVDAQMRLAPHARTTRMLTPEGRADYVEQAVRFELFLREAKRRGLHESTDAKVEELLALANAARASVHAKVRADVAKDTQALRRHYDANQGSFTTHGLRRGYVVSFPSVDAADEFVARVRSAAPEASLKRVGAFLAETEALIEAGGDLSKRSELRPLSISTTQRAAAEANTDPETHRSIGKVGPAQARVFRAAPGMFATDLLEVSTPWEHDGLWLVALPMSEVPEVVVSFDEARENIVERLVKTESVAAFGQTYRNWRTETDVVVDTETLARLSISAEGSVAVPKEHANEVLFQVGETKITLALYAKSAGLERRSLKAEEWTDNELLEKWISLAILAERGRLLTGPEKDVAKMRVAQFLVHSLERIIESKTQPVPPTDEEVRAAYEADATFKRPEMRRFMYLATQTKAEAQGVRDELLAMRPKAERSRAELFLQLAYTRSIRMGEDGRPITPFASSLGGMHGTAVPEDYLAPGFGLELFDVSAPIQVGDEWHLILLDAVREKKVVSFGQAEASLRRRLSRASIENAKNELEASLRTGVKIETFPEVLEHVAAHSHNLEHSH